MNEISCIGCGYPKYKKYWVYCPMCKTEYREGGEPKE